MNKRHLHHVWRYLRKVRPWYFLGLASIFGVICLVSLRSNNEQMIKLREAVYTADKNNGNVEQALFKLRSYVYSHMNTSLATGPNAVHPPIQLKYTYERLQAAQQEKLRTTNSTLYTAAEAYCEGLNHTDFSGKNRVPCVTDYVFSHNATLPKIPDALYKFDFTSAGWSPDAAGWSLVLTIASGALFVLSAVYHLWAKKYLS